MNKILFLTLALMLSPLGAHAQEYGVLAGVHQTGADSNMTGDSVDGVFNFKAGFAAAFPLTNQVKFRTGLIYDQRHVKYKYSTGAEVDLDFDYFDVPALVQYNVNEMFGFFGGLVIGINANDSAKPKASAPAIDATSLLPILSLGVNMMFQDMIGFDVYYERGMGDVSRLHENFHTFGANFLYWF